MLQVRAHPRLAAAQSGWCQPEDLPTPMPESSLLLFLQALWFCSCPSPALEEEMRGAGLGTLGIACIPSTSTIADHLCGLLRWKG